ncbi:glycosyltransferase family 4 protein [Chloroflexus aggregans]|uniref:Glycosyl transferase group 1 n=1 Tax=Chloroflexus aggregans (strain MD-66 / DSM 9485) TaxID=326427 RepID=B8G3W4_CHLAD|nr:glycosyltransferase family 4 protein [Chloroflexus aggregans]ACL25366.1 glycosyl transferase group 1 [Chloroflexus aggregans DSM 9485]
MRILQIHNDYREPGGETAVYRAEVALLQRHGHQVLTWQRDNTEIFTYNLYQKSAFLVNTIYNRQVYYNLQAFVRDKRPDVAHVHNVFPLISPSVYRALRKLGIPIVQTVHNYRFLCPNALFYTHGQICERCKYGNTLHAVRWQCYRKSYALSALYAVTIGLHRRWGTFEMIDRFIVLTPFVGQKLIEAGFTSANKINVLGNFLPDPLPAPGSFEHREPYVVYLGRLSPEKGVNVLLDALVDLSEIKLKIAGDGPQKEALQTKVQKQGLQVDFLGHVTGEKKSELLRRAMVAVVPSVCYETFSLAAIESMASGTPVVASDAGSLPFVVEGGKSGVLFRAGDSQDLQRKLAWLLAHPQKALAMGYYARRVVEQRYSASAHYNALMEIYNSVIKG